MPIVETARDNPKSGKFAKPTKIIILVFVTAAILFAIFKTLPPILETRQAVSVANKFMESLKEGDETAAYSLMSEDFQGRISRQDLIDSVQNPPLSTVAESGYSAAGRQVIESEPKKVEVKYNLEYRNKTYQLSIIVVEKSDGDLAVEDVTLGSEGAEPSQFNQSTAPSHN